MFRTKGLRFFPVQCWTVKTTKAKPAELTLQIQINFLFIKKKTTISLILALAPVVHPYISICIYRPQKAWTNLGTNSKFVVETHVQSTNPLQSSKHVQKMFIWISKLFCYHGKKKWFSTAVYNYKMGRINWAEPWRVIHRNRHAFIRRCWY